VSSSNPICNFSISPSDRFDGAIISHVRYMDAKPRQSDNRNPSTNTMLYWESYTLIRKSYAVALDQHSGSGDWLGDRQTNSESLYFFRSWRKFWDSKDSQNRLWDRRQLTWFITILKDHDAFQTFGFSISSNEPRLLDMISTFLWRSWHSVQTNENIKSAEPSSATNLKSFILPTW
jgi:hypothetical protein